LALNEEHFVLLFVGHEYARKGLGLALAALSSLDDRYVLLVLGGSEEMANAERRSLAPAQRSRVTFLGRRNDVERYYHAADALVLPSAYETGPLVLLEALSLS
jgi:glycosyltransferase involved in cell wall biosynthesis